MIPTELGAISLAASDPGVVGGPLMGSLSTGTAVVEECRGVLEKHARSFSAAAVFLTPQMRDDAAIAYAFCRLVDDAVDEAPSESAARQDLSCIEAMLNWEGEATPIVAAYMDLCRRRGIGLQPARDLIRGAKTDFGTVRIESDEDLLLYCYRVAGTVGLMMCGILGVKEATAARHAVDLGIGMQITNICRDVLEDARRDRVYLPRKRLMQRGINSEDVARVALASAVSATPAHVRIAIAEVVSDLLHEADHYYNSGAEGFSHIPRRPRLAITVARSLYREIGVSLRAVDCDPLAGRVRVNPWRKLVLTAHSAVAWFFGMFSHSKPFGLSSGSPQLPPR